MTQDHQRLAPTLGGSALPDISIVLPTRNRLALLRRQIDSIRGQQCELVWELIVVDNGSTDGTQEAMRELAASEPRIHFIVAVDRFDAAYARNVGAAEAKADRLAFVDDDDVVGDGWLAALYNALTEYPLIAPRIDYDLLNSQRIVDGWPRTQSAGLIEIGGIPVSTGHVGMTKELWNRLGGQRTGLLVGEDMDLTIRAGAEFGIPPRFESSAVYHRQLPTTLAGCFRQGRRDGRGRVQRVVLDTGQRLATWTEVRQTLGSFGWLLTRAPFAAVGRRPYLWMMSLGTRVGQLQQSLRMRAFIP